MPGAETTMHADWLVERRDQAVGSPVAPPAPDPGGEPRLGSLDFLRGAAVGAMVFVNDQPWAGPYYRQLVHSSWNGWTFADTIFPCFLFTSGAAMAFSLGRRIDVGTGPASIAGRIARRCLVLFCLGLVLNAVVPLLASNGAVGPVLAHLRIMGVLQRIALAFLLASTVVLTVRRVAVQALVAVALLLGYWALLTLVPVPGHGGAALTPVGNLGSWLDHRVFGTAHLYAAGMPGYDPEGLLGTIPATVTVLIGYWAGLVLRARRGAGRPLAQLATAGWLAVAGVVLVCLGLWWGRYFPINKRLWTSSFTVLMAGWSMLALAVAHLALGGPRGEWTRRLAAPMSSLGTNAIVVYAGTELTGDVLGTLRHTTAAGNGSSLAAWAWSHWFVPLAGPLHGALIYPATVLLAWCLIAMVLTRRGWVIRA